LFFLFVSSIVRNLHSYKSPYITTWHGCTRIYNIIIMWLLHFFLKLINKQNMTWINKSIETHSFFHILSLPFINKTPIPLQYLSSIILWL
jgi:hypothetical protein